MEFGSLRQRILQLAVSGQLVEQLDSEPEVEQVGSAPKQDEVPFELPPKWKWVQIGQVFSLQAGKFIKASLIEDEGKYPCYGANGIRGYVDIFNNEGTCNLIGRVGSCGSVHMETGKIYVTDNAVIATQCDLVDAGCAYYFLTALNLKQYATATAQPLLNKGTIAKVWYPLAPLKEQVRIVAKVNDLLGRLEQMEAAYSEFAGPMAEHFRNLMLDKAIRGEIVPQLDSEPEVEQVGPAPKPEEVPFELPPKWKWAKVSSVGQVVGGATPKSNISEYWENPTVTWITTADLTAAASGYVSDGARGITELGLKNCSAKLVPPGSVIYTTRGARIGDLAIATKECCTNQGCKTLIPDTTILTSKWAFYALMHATPMIRNIAAGTTFAEISGKKFGEVFIPIPPIEEQRRIVAKLEEVFAGVEKLGSLMEYA